MELWSRAAGVVSQKYGCMELWRRVDVGLWTYVDC